MPITRRILKTGLVFYFLSQILFLVNIQFPRTHNFDEFHYVPSAKQFLDLRENQNWEHPPLGKLIMAAGIGVWGDRPIGWRYMSTVFGSLTLVGMYFLALVLFGSESTAIWVALLTIVNQLLYVQARIGMLDTFMVAFLVWGLVGFCASWNPDIGLRSTRKLLAFTGLMLGLSMACKWFSVVAWVACIGLVGLIRILQSWEVKFGHPRAQDWYSPQLWKGIHWKQWITYLGIIPVGAYFLTFLPFVFVPNAVHSPLDFLSMQFRMWDGQLRVTTSHPYMSQWFQWPLLTRPIWYAFDKEGENSVRGVLLLGNPLIMFTGLLALGTCAWDWITRRNRDAFLILFFYLVFYVCWVVIPRKISFYYYYYPAGLMLSLALGYVFHHEQYLKIFKNPETRRTFSLIRWVFLGSAAAIFVYFFPILAALKIPSDSFRNWMWLSSWI